MERDTAPGRSVPALRHQDGPPLTNVWVGLYTELASGCKKCQSVWPPSGWFNKKWIEYDGPQRLLREHYCLSQPMPAACQLATAPYWAGVQVLTRPDSAAGQGVTLSAWRYSPGSSFRDQDIERYALMSTGVAQPLTGDSLLPSSGDPEELLAVGPFASLVPGDSVVVDFALVGGAEIPDLQAHAASAQAVYDAGYQIAVVPARLSLAEARVESGVVSLAWLSADGGVATAAVERSGMGGGWSAIGEVAADPSGYLRFVDRDALPGQRYGYRLSYAGGTLGETWVDVPGIAFGLYGSRVNPVAAGVLRVEFALASSAPARLELLDVAGRRVASREVGPLGAGTHAVELGGTRGGGIYFLRLTQGLRTAESRVVVLP